MTQETEPNWKEIAIALGQRVNFAIQFLDGKSGLMHDTQANKIMHWHDYFADGMEMLPNVTVDREILATMRLPKRQGEKARKEIKERREKEKELA